MVAMYKRSSNKSLSHLLNTCNFCPVDLSLGPIHAYLLFSLLNIKVVLMTNLLYYITLYNNADNRRLKDLLQQCDNQTCANCVAPDRLSGHQFF